MKTLLGLANGRSYIDGWSIIKYDIIYWLLVIMSTLLFDNVVKFMTASVSSRGIGSSLVGLPVYIVVLGALIAATRTKGILLWGTFVVSLLCFSRYFSQLLPGLASGMVIGAIGCLAIARMIEYINMRFIVKLENPKLTVSAICIYTMTGIVCFTIATPLIGYIVCMIHSCGIN